MSSLTERLEAASRAEPGDPAAANEERIDALIKNEDRREGYRHAARVMLRYELRRIELANTVTPTSMAALGALIAAAAGSRYGETGTEFASVLRGVALLIPFMASIYCFVIIMVSRSLWSSELLAAEPVFCYEETYTGGIGHANSRYHIVTKQSDWMPATTEVAAFAWFMTWWIIQILVRYFLG